MPRLTAGVDLGGTKIQTVLLRGDKVAGSARVLTPQSGADAVLAAITDSIKASIAAAGARTADLGAVGVGSPGAIDVAAGTVGHSPNVPGFETDPPPRRWQERGRPTKLFDIMRRKGRDRVTSGVIAGALERRDEVTVELIDGAVWALGLALANAQNLLDLQAIIVGGGLGDRLGQPFVERV